MLPQDNFPPVIVLSETYDGQVQSLDTNQNPLPLLSHNKDLALIYVPILLVEQQLAYKDYALYFLGDKENLVTKINKIQEQENDAIVLIDTDEVREAYFIEDKMLVISLTSPAFLFEYVLGLLKGFQINGEGKLSCSEDLRENFEEVIKRLRIEARRGNEAGTSCTKTGKNVFSRNFGPCNAVIAMRKIDHQFVIYHALGMDMDRSLSNGEFLNSIDAGGGSIFTAVMQNLNKKNRFKAPVIAGRLAVQLGDKNVNRFDFQEGYTAIACINSNTVILTNCMEIFRDEEEKMALISKFNLENIESVRIVDVETERITLVDTVKDIQALHKEEKNSGLLKQLLKQLDIFDLKTGDLPDEETRSACCFM